VYEMAAYGFHIFDLEGGPELKARSLCREEFKRQVSQRRANEMARLKAEAERKRHELKEQRKRDRLTAAKQAYIEQCKKNMEELFETEKIKADEKEAAERKAKAETRRLQKIAEEKAEEERKRILKEKYDRIDAQEKAKQAVENKSATVEGGIKPAAGESYKPPVTRTAAPPSGGAYKPPVRSDGRSGYRPPGGAGGALPPSSRGDGPSSYRPGGGSGEGYRPPGRDRDRPAYQPPGAGGGFQGKPPSTASTAGATPSAAQDAAAAPKKTNSNSYVPPHLRNK
jgi:hypothetical protein